MYDVRCDLMTKQTCIDMCDVRHISHTRFSFVEEKKIEPQLAILFNVNAAVTHEQIHKNGTSQCTQW